MTGQREECEHIVGFMQADFPEHGEVDHLVLINDLHLASLPFHFCPLCGIGLEVLSLTRKSIRVSEQEHIACMLSSRK